jgi:hypothetical protein
LRRTIVAIKDQVRVPSGGRDLILFESGPGRFILFMRRIGFDEGKNICLELSSENVLPIGLCLPESI